MSEEIFLRTEFMSEYDPCKVPYVEYEAVDEIPKNTDFVSKERRTIVLRNKYTGKLERLNYEMVGGVPNLDGGIMWYYGRVIPECGMDLVFNFDFYGKLSSITASYSAPTRLH